MLLSCSGLKGASQDALYTDEQGTIAAFHSQTVLQVGPLSLFTKKTRFSFRGDCSSVDSILGWTTFNAAHLLETIVALYLMVCRWDKRNFIELTDPAQLYLMLIR